MKIKDIINNKKVTVSFEVFPPKQWDKIANTKKVVDEMVKDKPSFMSVTYGAAGTTSGFKTPQLFIRPTPAGINISGIISIRNIPVSLTSSSLTTFVRRQTNKITIP